MDCEQVSGIRKHRLLSGITTMDQDKENGLNPGIGNEMNAGIYPFEQER